MLHPVAPLSRSLHEVKDELVSLTGGVVTHLPSNKASRLILTSNATRTLKSHISQLDPIHHILHYKDFSCTEGAKNSCVFVQEKCCYVLKVGSPIRKTQ
jgi:hypothetical protein